MFQNLAKEIEDLDDEEEDGNNGEPMGDMPDEE